MELSEAILTRRSVRNFRQGNIPDDSIREKIGRASCRERVLPPV